MNKLNGSSATGIAPLSPEEMLSGRDPVLGSLIALHELRWPHQPTEDPIWGLVRIVMAQQISTRAACRLAERVKSAYPKVTTPSLESVPQIADLRAFGLPERRAQCCVNIVEKSDEIRDKIRKGETWESALGGIKGIGPWTIAVFRIMVLRDPDVLPIGDVGLDRAIANIYGMGCNLERLAENWRPFRSVACWYLWKTLGNQQLG